jgi:small subunit ribosomal protein S3e
VQATVHCFTSAAATLLLAGVKGRRIRELTSVVQKRFKFPEGSVELYAEKVGGGWAAQGVCWAGRVSTRRQ